MPSGKVGKIAGIFAGTVAVFTLLVGCSEGTSNGQPVNPASNAGSPIVSENGSGTPTGAPVSDPGNSESSSNSTASIAGLWDFSNQAVVMIISITANNTATVYQPDQSGQCLLTLSGSLVHQQDNTFLFQPDAGQAGQSFTLDVAPDGAGNLVFTDAALNTQVVVPAFTDLSLSDLDSRVCGSTGQPGNQGTAPTQGSWTDALAGVTVKEFESNSFGPSTSHCTNFRADGTFRQEVNSPIAISEFFGQWRAQGQFPNEVGVIVLNFNDGDTRQMQMQFTNGELRIDGALVISNREGC